MFRAVKCLNKPNVKNVYVSLCSDISLVYSSDEHWWLGLQWLTGQIEDWPITPEDLPIPESSLKEKKSTLVLLVPVIG